MKHFWFAGALMSACSAEPTDPTDTAGEPATGADDSAPDTSSPPSPSVTAAFTPATVVAGNSSQLDVWIENFEVVDPTASPMPEATPGEGHYHLYLDGKYILAAWTPYVTIETSSDTVLGDYVFRVALVDSEHNEIVPTVDTEATLTVE